MSQSSYTEKTLRDLLLKNEFEPTVLEPSIMKHKEIQADMKNLANELKVKKSSMEDAIKKLDEKDSELLTSRIVSADNSIAWYLSNRVMSFITGVPAIIFGINAFNCYLSGKLSVDTGYFANAFVAMLFTLPTLAGFCVAYKNSKNFKEMTGGLGMMKYRSKIGEMAKYVRKELKMR